MVLIVSEEFDVSTRNIIDWLSYLGKQHLRINNIDSIVLNSFTLSNNTLNFQIYLPIYNREINSSEIESVWIRRGELFLKEPSIFSNAKLEVEKLFGINSYLNQELTMLNFSLYRFIEENARIHIDGIHSSINKKLDNLILAKKAKLNIPATAIIQTKIDLQRFQEKYGTDIVTKSISESMGFQVSSGHANFYTSHISENDIINSTDSFFPSLIQQRIAKKFEVRVFYLRGEIYAAATFAFSSIDNNLADVRLENHKDIRIVPYKLSQREIRKICIFMNLLKRDTGSLDFIKSKNGKLIFLEMNPVGQFGFVSNECNYYIEKRLAQIL